MKKNSSSSLSEMDPRWKGDKHKPRKVMTTKLPSGRSPGVYALYCKVVNGKVVNVDR